MPDIYFSRPCPSCGGKVRRPEGADYAECTACKKRFQLKEPTPQGKAEKGGKEKQASRVLSALKHMGRAVKHAFLSLYEKIYRGVRKKNDRIPLPKPQSEIKKPEQPPAPPMTEGQRALYAARKRQLRTRGEEESRSRALTKSERFERFVNTHRTLTIALSVTVLSILLFLLTVGITYCVKESRINKNDFKIIYGTEGIDDFRGKATYKFLTNNGKTMKINMNAIASLCDLTISGTRDEPKYAVRGGPSYVRFKIGSDIALVNGRSYEMDVAAEYDKKGDLWVDLLFADDILSGVTFTVDRKINVIKVERIATAEGTVLDPIYETISISAGNRTEVAGGETVLFTGTITYKTDVSAYMDDLYPVDPSYLFLANKQHPMDADFVPEELVSVSVPATRIMELRRSAARALEAMFQEMAADGITDVSITSAYRSYTYQQYLFDRYVEDEKTNGLSESEAIARVETYSARAGYSEHQTGLCVDFWTRGMTDLVNEQFEPSAACEWLRNNAHKFGFVLRYPADKTNVTGYSYESWHYRFVGVDAACEIVENGWCLEEYLEKHG